MPALYLHIPFCKQACHYCDFHFSTSKQLMLPVRKALVKELELRAHELGQGAEFQTVYFGGGTPSLLSIAELQELMTVIRTHYTIAPGAEITLEANPDDLSADYPQQLFALGINRLSIGIQSFRDADLQLMNRAHRADEAAAAVQRAQAAGFENITIDLIYGIPGLDAADWEENLQRAFALNVPHVSAYCLTVEPRTALAHFVKEGKVNAVDEQQASEQFLTLVRRMNQNGFEQYEISNFGKPGFFSRHNSSYWKGEAYIGIGPSAHSFDGKERRWNVSNNARYAAALASGEPFWEKETLDIRQRFNEYVMIRLRTMWGCDLAYIRDQFGASFEAHARREAAPYLASGDLLLRGDTLVLSEHGRLLADRIASDLFDV